MHFSSNIKLLRTRKNITQDEAASQLGITRSTLNSYENGSIRNPTLEALMLFSKYFRVSIDTLIKTDLTKLSEHQLSELEQGRDAYIIGSRLRILATTVDSQNRENIELVSHKAKAGYKTGYADPGYISRLPSFQLPILYNDRKYRMFQVSGDSMLPVPDKSWVIGEYIENWYDIKNGQACIILTLDEGIVFKLVNNHLKKKRTMELVSLNTEYQPYEVHANEVKEVWKFCNFISSELPDASMQKHYLLDRIEKIQSEIGGLRKVLRQE